MKRSLAPPRRDKPAGTGLHGGLNDKKTALKIPEARILSNDKPIPTQMEGEPSDKIIAQKFEERYRNKNLNALPTPLLVTLSTLTTLDISYNQLTDSQIELIMNSCTKLSTLCIDGNITCLIPATIGKLKLLRNFRHDWMKLGDEMYEPENKLEKIKEMAKKPNFVTKVNRVVGIDFTGYCQSILDISMDSTLADSINKSDCSSYSKENMLKQIEDAIKNKTKEKQKLVTINEAEEKSIFPGCFGIIANEERKKEEKWKELPHPREASLKDAKSEAETDAASVSIKIEDIRDLTDKDITIFKVKEEVPLYKIPGMPLHELFSIFDNNSNGPAEIDGLLLKGFNPNIYDSNGVSPYHICINYKQKKGLDYLLQISSNNPGFFDLEMPSTKDCRNILHYSVFTKNYQFTKTLIEFGIPVDKRDASGARILHLVDQNYEFLILLRKLLKRKTKFAKNVATLSVPHTYHQNKRSYVKHPERQREESKFRITYSKNDKLLEMFEAATGVHGLKK